MRSIAVSEQVTYDLMESLLLRYVFDASERTLTLVTGYWQKAAGSSRAFILLKFQGVDAFERIRGTLEKLQRFNTEYVLDGPFGSKVVQGVKPDFHTVPKRLELDFGDFGGIAFTFESVTGKVRDTRAKEIDSVWKYFDLETGEPLEFYDIFRGVE